MAAFGSMFGIKPAPLIREGMDPASAATSGDKMFLDLVREQGQKNYELLDKEIRENGETWLQQMAEEEKKLQEEQMKSMKGGLSGWFGSGK